MFTRTSLLASLPPASLAATDLPRFVVRAVGRLGLTELPGVRAVIREDDLLGYPSTLAPLLDVVLGRLIADGSEPSSLDPPFIERLLGQPRTLVALEQRVELVRTILRPGDPLNAEVRSLLGERFHVLPGAGPQLGLVVPVELLQLRGLGWSTLRSPALARPMDLEQAEALRAAWATIEERTGWPAEPARVWEGRFAAVASRPGWDAHPCVAPLAAMSSHTRHRLWHEILEHLRDQELADAHRPGPGALARRIAAASIRFDEAALESFEPLARAAYEACAEDPVVAAGYCSCVESDLTGFRARVDIPDGILRPLEGLAPSEIGRLMAVVAADEQGAVQAALPDELDRALRALRDAWLRRRYRRNLLGLTGVDPLTLVRAAVDSGDDRQGLIAAARELALQAEQWRPPAEHPAPDAPHRTAAEGAPASARPAAATPVPGGHGDGPAREPAGESTSDDGAADASVADNSAADASAADNSAADNSAAGDSTADDPVAADAGGHDSPAHGSDPAHGGSGHPAASPPPRNPFASPAAASRAAPGVSDRPGSAHRSAVATEGPPSPTRRPTRVRPITRTMELPPIPDISQLPRPRRPRTRPRTRPIEMPPLADIDTARSRTRPAGAVTASADAGPGAVPPRPLASLSPPVAEVTAPVAAGQGAPARPTPPPPSSRLPSQLRVTPRPPSDRRATGTRPGSRLVTPAQAEDFYADAFRELQVLERDLLERGPWSAARQRVATLSTEAGSLLEALGPPARSGDERFKEALNRVELVQSYLGRVALLLDGKAPEPGDVEASPSVLGRLGRLLRRDDE